MAITSILFKLFQDLRNKHAKSALLVQNLIKIASNEYDEQIYKTLKDAGFVLIYYKEFTFQEGASVLAHFKYGVSEERAAQDALDALKPYKITGSFTKSGVNMRFIFNYPSSILFMKDIWLQMRSDPILDELLDSMTKTDPESDDLEPLYDLNDDTRLVIADLIEQRFGSPKFLSDHHQAELLEKIDAFMVS